MGKSHWRGCSLEGTVGAEAVAEATAGGERRGNEGVDPTLATAPSMSFLFGTGARARERATVCHSRVCRVRREETAIKVFGF